MEGKVKRIYKKSVDIIKDCSLKNGAIVASNILDDDYPKDVKSYYFVWPRDASFVCYAADVLGLHKIPRKFFRWCWENAELFNKEGVFLAQKFYPHGRAAGDYDIGLKVSDLKNKKLIKIGKSQITTRFFYIHFQPDQTASLLWAIHHHSNFEDTGEFKEMVDKSADGICNYWKKDHFKLPTFDIWEETPTFPKFKQVHVYSLAMFIKGLKCASQLTKPKTRWTNCIKQMRSVLEKSYKGYFVRTFGKRVDKRVDPSLLGLVWPSEEFNAGDPRIAKTVEKILKTNELDGGIFRYKKDKYDGKMKLGKLALGGGGAWPILNFWLSIYYSKLGDRRNAKKYFDWVIQRVDEKLPEQIINDRPASIVPLAWSHAMFIVAGKSLKLF